MSRFFKKASLREDADQRKLEPFGKTEHASSTTIISSIPRREKNPALL
jgi:hypothetical protein